MRRSCECLLHGGVRVGEQVGRRGVDETPNGDGADRLGEPFGGAIQLVLACRRPGDEADERGAVGLEPRQVCGRCLDAVVGVGEICGVGISLLRGPVVSLAGHLDPVECRGRRHDDAGSIAPVGGEQCRILRKRSSAGGWARWGCWFRRRRRPRDRRRRRVRRWWRGRVSLSADRRDSRREDDEAGNERERGGAVRSHTDPL